LKNMIRGLFLETNVWY